MGMLMYEDMKVSVLQLLLVRKVSWAVGDFSLCFFFTQIRMIKGGKKLTVRGEKWCSRRLREEE